MESVSLYFLCSVVNVACYNYEGRRNKDSLLRGGKKLDIGGLEWMQILPSMSNPVVVVKCPKLVEILI